MDILYINELKNHYNLVLNQKINIESDDEYIYINKFEPDVVLTKNQKEYFRKNKVPPKTRKFLVKNFEGFY